MGSEPYYTLVSSLPLLPHFSEAQWLPLSRKRLDQRLSMLSEEHAKQLQLAEELIKWQRQPISRTTEQVAGQFRRALPLITHPALREFVEYRMAQRTALVALRRRRLGLPKPADDETWGVGPWLPLVKASWDRNDLGLTPVALARGRGETAVRRFRPGAGASADGCRVDAPGQDCRAQLLRLRAGDRLRVPLGHPAALDGWDILQRWMSYDAEQGSLRFKELVAEVTRDQQPLFA
jgi:hypothetical protein